MPIAKQSSTDLIDFRSSPRAKRNSGTPVKGKVGSKLGTPVKSSIIKTKSPIKKDVDDDLSSIQDLPESISEALKRIDINNLSDMKEMDPADLSEECAAQMFTEKHMQEDPHRSEISIRMQKEILTAWMRFLVARSNNKTTKGSWREWIDTGKIEEVSAKGMLEAEAFLKTLKPKQLIKQRSKLKKVEKPRSRRIDFGELRQMKGRLVKIPAGRAIAKTVSNESLSKARAGLKKTPK